MGPVGTGQGGAVVVHPDDGWIERGGDGLLWVPVEVRNDGPTDLALYDVRVTEDHPIGFLWRLTGEWYYWADIDTR